VFYGLFSAAALIAHRGMVVLNAPRPRAQSAEVFSGQSAGRDSGKRD
jgi:hypothetical protein